jgi:hypothetical protein
MPTRATYSLGSNTRAGSADISITDGGPGGIWTATGAVGVGGYGFTWTATFYDGAISGGGGGEEVIDPEEEIPPTERRCTLNIASNVGGQTWDFAMAGISLTGTASISIPTVSLADIGAGFSVDNASAYDLQNGVVTMSMTLMGKTRSGTTASSTTYRVFPVWVLRSRGAVTGNGSGSQTVEWDTAAPGTCSAPSSSVSKSGTSVAIGGGAGNYNYSVSASTDTLSVFASVSKSFTGALPGPTIFAEGNAGKVQDRNATLSLRLNRLMAAWPTPVEFSTNGGLTWTSSSDGDDSIIIAQRKYDVYSTCWDHTDTSFQTATQRFTASTIAPITPRVRGVGGVYPYDQPLYIHGPRWTAISFSQTEVQDVDDGTSLTPTGDWVGAWTGTSGGSVAVVSGAIEITGSAGKKARRTFTNGQKYTAWQGYSRLRIRLKASTANHSITVRLGADFTSGAVTYKSPTWSLSTGTADTYTEHLIDLGAENNGPDLSVDGYGFIFGVGIFPGAYGSRHYNEMTLEDLGSGTYSVDYIKLTNSDDGMGGYNDAQLHMLPDQGVDRQSIWGVADNNEVFNAPIAPKVSITANVSTTNDATNSRRIYGWTIGDLAPGTAGAEPWPTSELTTNRHDARFLGGGGLYWNGSTQVWTLPFDGGSPTDAQWLVQTIEWDWPTTLGGFISIGGDIGAGACVGSSAWGRVLTASDSSSPVGKDGVSGETVSITEFDGTALAITTTDSSGWFSMPAIASRERSGTIYLTAVGRTVQVSVGAFRTRVVIQQYTPPDGSLLAMACSATGRVCRAYKDSGGVMLMEFYYVNLDSWETVTTSLTLTGSGALCYDNQSSSQRLWLVYEDTGTTIKSRYTDDEGGTWSVATTITSAGTFPAIALSPTGVTHYFWVDGSSIKSSIYDSLGNVLTSVFTVVASGVASAAIDAIHDGTVIYLTYKNTTGSGQVVTVKSMDGGLTFA